MKRDRDLAPQSNPTMLDAFSPVVMALQHVDANAHPAWGIMTAHHMVEHLSDTIRLSRTVLARYKGPWTLARRMSHAFFRWYLGTPIRFPRSVPHPVYGSGLRAIRTRDLPAAVEELYREIEKFESYYAENPGATPAHPLFGPLDRDGWICFHKKHMLHHLRQFGL